MLLLKMIMGVKDFNVSRDKLIFLCIIELGLSVIWIYYVILNVMIIGYIVGV